MLHRHFQEQLLLAAAVSCIIARISMVNGDRRFRRLLSLIHSHASHVEHLTPYSLP